MPSISQIAAVPSSFCQRMSDLPSPLKSPVPSTCQLGARRWADGAAADQAGAVHQPDRRRAVVVLPQDVGLAVAVEVAGAARRASRARIVPNAARRRSRCVPFISQIAGVPSSFRHRMSALPSPLKSPVPSIVPARPRIGRAAPPPIECRAVHQPDRRRAVVVLPQDVGLAVAVEVAGALDVPARARIRADEPPPIESRCRSSARSPAVPLSFCHRMSALPSPLKSPLPSTCQPAPDCRARRRRQAGAVHQPDRRRAVVVLPQDVALAVAVEIVRLHDDVVGDLEAPLREAAGIAAGVVGDVKAPRRVDQGATKSRGEGGRACGCGMVDDDAR